MSGLEDTAFGALLRTHRLAAGITQETLAERARISIDTVSALERGFRQAPHRDTVQLLASALTLGPQDRARLTAAAARPRAPRTPSTQLAEAARATDVTQNNLPLSLTRLVGRERELEEIVALAGAHRLVTLTGAGGIGKTSTALQVGGMLLERMPGGVWLIDLAPLRDGSLIAATISRALGVHEASTQQPLESLLAGLKNKTLFLILDNCEHVIGNAATVADAVLQRCAGVRILATSREPIRVSGEHTYPLPSLSTPPVDSTGLAAVDAAAYGAIGLFIERARAVDYRFALTDENASVIADICRRLDGIALAIELAAARVRMFSPADLARRLDDRFRILTGGRRTALPRQQTMWSTIDWSHDLLDGRERTLFRRVSIFSGGWTTDAALAVCADSNLDANVVLDVLILLVEKSLVVAELSANEARYRLLESTQAYALEKLHESGEHETIARRHAEWVAGLTIDFRKKYSSLPREQWQRSLEPEVDNVRAALSYASGKSDAGLAVRILWLARASNAIASKGTKIRPLSEELESPYVAEEQDAGA